MIQKSLFELFREKIPKKLFEQFRQNDLKTIILYNLYTIICTTDFVKNDSKILIRAILAKKTQKLLFGRFLQNDPKISYLTDFVKNDLTIVI